MPYGSLGGALAISAGKHYRSLRQVKNGRDVQYRLWISVIAGSAAAKVSKIKKTVSEPAKAHLANAARRMRTRKAAPVRRDFLRSADATPPPLVRLLRGGRGGGVRLKLYLTMLWIAAKEPYDTRFAARGWAELLDLAEPDTNGLRRVSDAIAWLRENAFVTVTTQSGHEPTVFLLDDGGSGAAYKPPGAVGEVYIKVPTAFWANGWIACLSARAVAMLLVLIDQEQLRVAQHRKTVWVAPDVARSIYVLSADTWTRGIQELKYHGIVSVGRQPVNEVFNPIRSRNTYKLKLARLDTPP